MSWLLYICIYGSFLSWELSSQPISRPCVVSPLGWILTSSSDKSSQELLIINKISFQLCFRSLSGPRSRVSWVRGGLLARQRGWCWCVTRQLNSSHLWRAAPLLPGGQACFCIAQALGSGQGGWRLARTGLVTHTDPPHHSGFCSTVLRASFYCRTRLSPGLTRRQERIQRKLAVDVANKFGIPLHQKVFRISATLCGTSLAK